MTDILGRLALVPYGEHGTAGILRAFIPEESVIVRTAPETEVSSTTSIPGPCSGPLITRVILAYQLAEKISECAQNSIDYILNEHFRLYSQ